MRIVIVTGEQIHHRNLCVELCQGHDIAGIVHPPAHEGSVWSVIRRFCRLIKNEGFVWAGLNVLGRRAFSERKAKHRQAELEKQYFPNASAYSTIPKNKIHHIPDLSAGAELLKSLKPDVTVCLGGPVYPRGFIEAAGLMLNFHSGVSPIYNGYSSIRFAFANGHPHLCGGTLMVMSPVVDGGDILGHYLPEIIPSDDSLSLYAKTLKGAGKMYENVLGAFETKGLAYQAIKQPRPVFYYRSSDWTIQYMLLAKRWQRKGLCARFVRAERIVEYWKAGDANSAAGHFSTSMQNLLWATS